jgi:hypothetical protein
MATKVKLIAENAIGATELDLSNLSTTNISEGDNLYYTDARVDSRLSSGSVSNIEITGYLRGPSTFTIDPAAHGDATGTLVVLGNLQVDGTTTTINSTTMEVDDLNITLASGAANAAAANGAGLTIEGASATLTYSSTADGFSFNKDLDVSGTVTVDGLTSSGNIFLDGSANPTVINKTSGAGNNPLYRLQADTNYWDMIGVFSDADDTFRIRYNGTDALKIANNGDISFYEDTGTTAKFFWDASAEQLGIGTSSPGVALDINRPTSTASYARVGNGGNVQAFIGVAGDNLPLVGSYTNHPLRFVVNTLEVARFDTSGRLLVGKTASNYGVEGVEIRATEGLITKDGGTALSLNRLTSDGMILAFAKDTTTVGSIGVYVSDRLYISDSNDCGLQFDSTLIRPCDSAGANNGSAIDLGASGTRFKNLYLSGYASVNALASPDGTSIVYPNNAGNVGISEPNPSGNCRLHVTDADVQMELEGTQGSNSGFINFDGTNLQLSTSRDMKTGAFRNTGKSNATLTLTGASGGSTIRMYTATADNTTATERLRIESSGNVGIGTTSPSEKLDVQGIIKQSNVAPNTSNRAYSVEIPVFLNSGQTHSLATLSSFSTGTTAVATFNFVGLYAYAGSSISVGAVNAATRRSVNNTAWANDSVQLGASGSTPTIYPTFFWDAGTLKATIASSHQYTGTIRITYQDAALAIL